MCLREPPPLLSESFLFRVLWLKESLPHTFSAPESWIMSLYVVVPLEECFAEIASFFRSLLHTHGESGRLLVVIMSKPLKLSKTLWKQNTRAPRPHLSPLLWRVHKESWKWLPAKSTWRQVMSEMHGACHRWRASQTTALDLPDAHCNSLPLFVIFSTMANCLNIQWVVPSMYDWFTLPYNIDSHT